MGMFHYILTPSITAAPKLFKPRCRFSWNPQRAHSHTHATFSTKNTIHACQKNELHPPNKTNCTELTLPTNISIEWNTYRPFPTSFRIKAVLEQAFRMYCLMMPCLQILVRDSRLPLYMKSHKPRSFHCTACFKLPWLRLGLVISHCAECWDVSAFPWAALTVINLFIACSDSRYFLLLHI